MNKRKTLNILLVNPAQALGYGKMRPPVQIHIGLAYLASMAEKNGDNIEVVDMCAEGLKLKDFTEVIKRKDYDIVGFTVTTPTLFSCIELAEQVKKRSIHTLIVFGGIHPTSRAREVLNFSCVDIVVKGEGEITFKEIIKNLKHALDLSSVKGLLYKKNGIIEETPPRDLIEDLDSLPFPARHLFKNRRYTYPDALYRDTAPMITSRGCSGMCTYCNAHQIFKRVFRARSAENIVDEIEFLIKSMSTREIHIWDDNFATIKKRVFEIRDEILRRNLKIKFAFPNGMRADFLNKEIIKALKEMGTYSIAVGVESGCQEVLNKARKGIKLEKIEEVFTLAKKMKLETWAFFIIGLPGENTDSIKRTIDFAKKISPDIAKFHILKPYPGTEVYDYLRSRNFILTEDYRQFGIHTPPVHRLETLQPSDILKWQKRAYVNFYLKPARIVKQISRIKTFNRFILNLQAGMGLAKMVLFRQA